MKQNNFRNALPIVQGMFFVHYFMAMLNAAMMCHSAAMVR